MEWLEYVKEYETLAHLKGKDSTYITEHLTYAKHLFNQGLPIIYSQKHLCMLIGYLPEYVYSISNSPELFYRCFYIKKKNGKRRRIDEPLPSLKEIQVWILKEILEKVQISRYAKAYIPGKSIKDNAVFHKNQKIVLSMDLKNFFPSIHFPRVLHFFTSIGYKKEVAVMLSNLCCFKRKLPQGAPTSPMLSNIIAMELDNKIVAFVSKKRIRYTRYADDLTFSGDFNPSQIIHHIGKIIKSEGFEVNGQKTRVRTSSQRQEVTGIVVNSKMQVSREERMFFRKTMYYIKKYGLENHMAQIGEKREYYLYHLIGRISYASFINPNDKNFKKYLEILMKEKNGI